MPTQMFAARQGTITPEMRRVAEREQLPDIVIRDEVARGRLIIPANTREATFEGHHTPVVQILGQLDVRPDQRLLEIRVADRDGDRPIQQRAFRRSPDRWRVRRCCVRRP